MRTRRTRTAALSDDGGVGVVDTEATEMIENSKLKTRSVGVSHPSNAAATGAKENQKANRVKRKESGTQATLKPDTPKLVGRKRYKLEIAQQQGKGPKKSAASRKQRGDHSTPQGEQQPPKEVTQEIDGASENHQASVKQTAEMGAKPAALRDEIAEMPEEDDAPEEVSKAAGKAGAEQQRQHGSGIVVSARASLKRLLPMQVSKAAGRAGAEQQRQQEREAAVQRRAAGRARAEKRAAVAAKQKADREAQRAVRGEEAASQRLGSMRDEPEQDAEDDLLPPEVLEAVIRESREAEKSQHSKHAAASKGALPGAKLGSKTGEKRRRWDPTQPRKVGPVYVQILDELPLPSASAPAKAFAQQQMFGRGRMRSTEMLLPTPKQRQGRGPPSAHRGPVLKPV